MSRKHNTGNEDMSQLPEVAIVLAGSGISSLQKTKDSIQEQSYKNVVVIQNAEQPAPHFFNNLSEEYEIYGLMNPGDIFASENSLQIIVNKLSEKFIGGVYADACVRHGEINQEFYFPSHNHQTFSKLIGVFPVFFKSETMQDKSLDENLQHLYGHDILVKISNSFIISHIPQLLFYLVSRQIDIQEDINYLSSINFLISILFPDDNFTRYIPEGKCFAFQLTSC